MNGDLLALGNAISQAVAKVCASPAIRRSNPLSALLVASLTCVKDSRQSLWLIPRY